MKECSCLKITKKQHDLVSTLSGADHCVSPLTRSHSAFVWTVLEYTDKFNSLKNSINKQGEKHG